MSKKKIVNRSPRVTASLDKQSYDYLVKNCGLDDISISAYVRELILKDQNAEIGYQNIDFITSIIREQLDIVLEMKLNRIIKLISATCIQSGAAAYLSAEALASFVPLVRQQEFNDAYIKARKQSAMYVKNFSLNGDLEQE